MKSWDSINVFLVLFAILCGVLARQNGDGSPSSLHGGDERAVTDDSMNAGEDDKISSPVSERWFSDVHAGHRLKIHESVSSSAPSPVTGTVRLRRSSSSYPDLRQGFFGDTVEQHFRFYDDFEINKYRSPVIANSDGYEWIQNRRKIQIEKSEPKEIPVDKFEVRPPTPPREPPAPRPPQPLSAEVVQKPRRGHRSVRSRATPENVRRRDTDSNSTKSEQGPPPAPPPPPPPAPPHPPFTPPRTALRNEAERKQGKLDRRKSNAAKEIKMVLASLYNQRKRKLQKAKTKRNEYPVTEPPHYQSKIPPPSPPPPPPPPPPRSSQSVFYGLFRKGSKSKKIHSVPAPPPQLPPPSSRTSKRKIQLDRHSHPPPPPPPAPPMSPRRRSGKPPRPIKPTNFYEDNYANSGRESPLIPIPPPPPPPFRVPPLKFVVRGDFAKIQSNQSSRCSSPERGEVIDLGWGLELTQSEGGDRIGRSENSGGRSFCQSPDVNTKADSFIARLRGEWRLESVHPVEEKETGLRPKPNMRPI
ncbi:PREDICTED: formin-like protein 20 isoform X2 [Tarenaya hassleriana]|nr:PREDICTED: formin-like protein 20 isoform X2 [Tarenaya hassleriana]XP_010539401.1 PREDICTED: formin-like protein 20 isoform X2 [Tarenaya hassleriana]